MITTQQKNRFHADESAKWRGHKIREGHSSEKAAAGVWPLRQTQFIQIIMGYLHNVTYNTLHV